MSQFLVLILVEICRIEGTREVSKGGWGISLKGLTLSLSRVLKEMYY